MNEISHDYGLFYGIQGSRCFFVRENSRYFIFSLEIPATFKICANEKKNSSSIISSYCRRRSVPVGVPTLEKCTCGCPHVGEVYLWVSPRWRSVLVGVPTLEKCTCGCPLVGEVYLWVSPRWRSVPVGVPTLHEKCTCGCPHVA